jgi:cytoskeletal protein CcmA (bactofilin family)
MFSEKKEKNSENPGTGQNRINDGTNLKGDISSNGFFRIDGTIEGTLTTPSKVVIGKTGVILGTLSCKNADVEGKIKGIIDITGTLSLKSTAYIDGDVITGKLSVEPGATFNATCTMKGSTKEFAATENSEQKIKDKKLQNHLFDRSKRTQSQDVGTKAEKE